MTASHVSLGRLWALMFTVFVDMVGFLMILPILPLFAERLGATATLIGLMSSTYAVAQLATAPAWGRMSDGRGRRPMMMLGVAIAGVAHLVFGIASTDWALDRFDSTGLIVLLFLSRLVQGAGGASTAVVQAYVGDAIVPEERAKALGWITAATSAGVAIGPALGAAVAQFGPGAAGFAAAALCVVNLFFVHHYLPESASVENRHLARNEVGVSLRHQMIQVLAHPRRPVSRLILVYGAAMMGFMAMNAVLALFLKERFGFTVATIGYVYTAVGVVSLLMRSLLVGPAVRAWGERGAMRAGLAALVAGFALQPLASTLPVYAATLIFIPIGTALLFPATSSLVSRFAERHTLGATMGVQQAYGGVARLFGPAWAGLSFELLGAGAPFAIAAVLAGFALLWALGVEASPKVSVSETMVAKSEASNVASG